MNIITTKAEFDALPTEYGIPRVIWTAWFGGAMSANRVRGMTYMQENLGVPICLVTSDNLAEFLLPDYPLHSAFEFLSDVHKSDYLRAYLAHHYGGAWHDIKPTAASFAEAFAEFADPEIYWKGKPELKGMTARVYDKSGRWIPDHWQEMVAASPFVCRPHTPMSQELIDDMNALLDRNLTRLRRNPARIPYAHSIKHYWIKQLCPSIRRQGNYPLNVTVFGDLLHPLILKYFDHVSRTLPFDAAYCLNFPYR